MSAKDGSSDTWVDVGSAGADVSAPARFDEAAVRYAGSELLGKGSMGRVLAVRDTHLGRQVAYKELREHLRGGQPVGEDMRARFVREARITARLEHPGIVAVHDIGHTAGGGLYYTMRFVDGRTLESALGEAHGTAARLALLPRLTDACQAIAYAHDRGVVHRDLKPANIVLGQYGETVVVDWGLAKELHDTAPELDAPSAHSSFGSATSTSHGSVLGTPAYMSPEQASGQTAEADARADVWSLGAILFELLAGRRLVPDVDPAAAVERVRTGALPSVRESAPRAPAELVAICERALARDPAQRYADAGRLAHDLEAFQAGELVYAYAYTPLERLARTVQRHRRLVAVGLLALGSVAAVTAASFQRVVAERDRARAADERSQSQLAAAHERSALEALAAGSLLEAEAFAVAALGLDAERPAMRGVLATVHAHRPPRLLGTVDSHCPLLAVSGETALCGGARGIGPLGEARWSDASILVLDAADGRVVVQDADTLRIFRDGSPLREQALVPGTRPAPVQLLDDGGLVLAELRKLRRLDAEGGERWSAGTVASGIMGMAALDGDRLVALTQSGGLYVYRLSTGELLTTVPMGDQGTFALASGEAALFVGSGEPTVVRVDTALAETHRRPVDAPVLHLALSADEQVLAVHTEDGAVSLLDANELGLLWHMRLPEEIDTVAWRGRELLLSTDSRVTRWDTTGLRPGSVRLDEGVADLAWSADGELVAAGSGDGLLTVIDAESQRAVHRFPTGPSVTFAVAWGPEHALYAANVKGGLWRYSPEGEREERVFEDDLVWVRHVEPTAHGLYFASQDPHLRRWTGEAPETVWSGPPPAPMWELDASPDGSHLAWTNNGHELRVAALPGLDMVWEETFAGDGPRSVTLSSGGELLARSTAAHDIEVFDVGTKRRVAFFTADAFAIDNLEFSADGRYLAAASWDEHVRVYDLAAGALAADLLAHTHRVNDVEFAPDGSRLASAGWDHTVRFAALEPLVHTPDALARDLVRDRGVHIEGATLAWVGRDPSAE